MEPTRADQLLADLPWLQALARELVGDPELAHDAVQDACVAALGHDGAVVHRRAWLATVLRNCLSLRGRGARRAVRRERVAARPEAVAGTGDLVQRAELQQRIVGRVLALSPPHRDAVLLRFFDGLQPRAIAARLGVPVATVHSRLQRALQQLRHDLDRDCGGRAAWVGLALAPASSLLPLPVLGVVMQAKFKVAFVVVAVAGTVTWWCRGDGAAGATAVPAEPVARRAASGGGDGGGGVDTSDPASAARTRVPVGERTAAAGAIRQSVRGRVVGCDGSALAGVPVVAKGDTAAATTDALGAFAIDLLPQPTKLTIADDRFVAVLAAEWNPDATLEPVLVAAPAVQVAGRVSDNSGLPVARAQIVFELPADFDARFPLPLDRGERLRYFAKSGDDGRFRHGRIPHIDGATLVAVADAYLPASVAVPPTDDAEVAIRMQRFAYEQGQIDGVVVDLQGAPVAGARVTMGVTSVVSDRDGRFALLLRRAGWPTAIVAAKAGYLPARLAPPRSGGARREEWPDKLVLRLGTTPLSLRGRVVDQDRQPVEGALVWLDDPTLLGIAGMLPVQTEYVLAGGEVPPQGSRQPAALDEPTQDGSVTCQNRNVDEPSACWFFVRADEHGAFELPGLLEREYRVRAFDPTSGVTVVSEPAPAGGSVELRVERKGLWPELRGRVVTVRGEPIAGIEVEHHVRLFGTDERVPGGRYQGNVIRSVQKVRTGADGAFVLHSVHPQLSTFGFAGDAILPRSVLAKDVADPTALVVTVEARCHVEVVLRDPAEADVIAAQDRDGEPIEISIVRTGSHAAMSEMELHDGKSGVFVLGERAAWLLLQKGGALVRKVPLQLQAGQTFRVQ